MVLLILLKQLRFIKHIEQPVANLSRLKKDHRKIRDNKTFFNDLLVQLIVIIFSKNFYLFAGNKKDTDDI